MKILALETTGKYGSAAVIADNGAAVVASSENEMNHLRDIIVMSEKVLKEAGIDKKDLTHVAASVGPGSFTGIRIGVSTARTLAQMLNADCIAVSSLEGLACRVKDDAADKGCGIIVTVINARRHQTYGRIDAVVSADDGQTVLTEVLVQEQYMIEDILQTAVKAVEGCTENRKIYITGDGIDAYMDVITEMLEEGTYETVPEELRYQSAETVAELARVKAEAGITVSYEELLPDYMRLSEAEQRLKEGTLSSKISKLK